VEEGRKEEGIGEFGCVNRWAMLYIICQTVYTITNTEFSRDTVALPFGSTKYRARRASIKFTPCISMVEN
jgi:hypothetical protein